MEPIRSGVVMGDNAVFEVSFYDLPGRRLTLAGATLSRRLDNGRGIWRLEAPRPGGALLELEGLGGPMALPKQIGKALPAFLRGDRPEQFLRLRVHPGDDRNDIEVLEGIPSNGSLAVGPGGLGATVLKLVGENADAADGPIGRLRSVLGRQYAEILRHDPGVRLDLDPEDVHRMRVAARRGRAVLRAARPLLDPDWSEPLRAELKWLGGSLGSRRDLDVLVARLREQVVRLEQPEQGAAETLVDALEQERVTAQAFAVEALASPRYFNLLDTLEAAARGPRVRRSEVSLSTLAAKEFRRLRKAAAAIGPESSDAELHRARILGKRARYAAEFAEPELGRAGRRFVARAKAFQDVLGAHQDAIVAEARLRSLLGTTAGPGAAFAAGRLVEQERARRREMREALPRAWQKLERSAHAWA
jgi:CHAD domain-containing protein